jgi:hypothetical protein
MVAQFRRRRNHPRIPPSVNISAKFPNVLRTHCRRARINHVIFAISSSATNSVLSFFTHDRPAGASMPLPGNEQTSICPTFHFLARKPICLSIPHFLSIEVCRTYTHQSRQSLGTGVKGQECVTFRALEFCSMEKRNVLFH